MQLDCLLYVPRALQFGVPVITTHTPAMCQVQGIGVGVFCRVPSLLNVVKVTSIHEGEEVVHDKTRQ